MIATNYSRRICAACRWPPDRGGRGLTRVLDSTMSQAERDLAGAGAFFVVIACVGAYRLAQADLTCRVDAPARFRPLP